MTAPHPSLWTAWRDPWDQINRELEPALRELGYGHVRAVDGSMRFAPLHTRCLAAFAELRALRAAHAHTEERKV
jgi:hypothetical protein